MTDVTPFLWFDDDGEAAILFYTALIPGSEVVSIARYPDDHVTVIVLGNLDSADAVGIGDYLASLVFGS